MLKERMESLPAGKAKATLNMQFKDVSGRMWAIDVKTTRWVFHDGKKWVESTPPPILEAVWQDDSEPKSLPPTTKQPDAPSDEQET